MQRFVLALAICTAVVSLSSSPARADEPAEPITWTVQIDPLTTALGISHILFERRVAPHLAVYAGPSLRLFDSPLTPDDEEGYKAYGVETGVRWFFDRAPTGWWAGARAIIAHLTFGDESRMGGYVSALAGHAWTFGGRWILSGALGVSYFDYDVGGVGVEGVLPGAHTGIGLTF